ncbi:transporter substrate-binding domain-containing protein [Vibrio sp. OCN044]|uniref:Transporter substrate-binding domain-containing protein n=1 Tax=Vibrio tetraodonis subsp. pristinus TaxID=2695891 RepID=A0A6L8LX52_9VIBR|nr:HD domain-containing phosphohydrolase [Vibrio tetraodonis]MYM59250.1 transporter substrate-binding domain-containing protein [Vibrio tetraodonis subsp. pristinus]
MTQPKAKKQTFSIRVTIGSLLLLVTALTATLALSIHYHFIYQTLEEHQLEESSTVAENVSDTMKETDTRMRNIAFTLAQVIDPLDKNHQWLPAFLATLEATPELYSVFFGTKDDDFYQIINLDVEQTLRKSMDAQPDDRWVMVNVKQTEGGQRKKTVSFVSQDLKVRKAEETLSGYFPSLRPWYRKAHAQADKVIKTEPYIFSQVAVSGQTYATQNASGTAVIGIDVLLSTLATILNRTFEEQLSEAYVFRQTGELLADTHPTPQEKPLPTLPLLSMTEQEQALIERLGPLRVSNQRNWAPIDYSVLGEPRGYAIDMVKMIGQITGIQWAFSNGLDWSELVSQFNNDKLDALHSLQYHKDGYAKGVFSDPIFSLPFGILVADNLGQVNDLKAFNGDKLAILSGWSIIPSLKKNYPEIEIIEVSDSFEGLTLLKTGKIKGFIDTSAILEHAVHQYFTDGVTVIEDIAPFNQGFETEFHIALSQGYANLLPIINRAIRQINDTQKEFLLAKWLGDSSATKHRVIPHAAFYDLMASPSQHGSLVSTTTKAGNTYVYLQPVGSSSPSEFLAITLPVSVLHSQVVRQVLYATGISALIMLPMLWLAWLSGTPVIQAIRSLKKETQKIQHRDYSQLRPVKSRIREISQLSSSVEEMANQLQAHEKQQEALLDSIVQLIARAIDDKSPYTAGHCNRVPVIAMMLAEAAEASAEPPFSDFRFNNEREKREFQMAAWLHDCGKITVPEYIVDKGTKLEANYNRLHEIRMRFEVLWRDITIKGYIKRDNGEDENQVLSWIKEQQTRLQEEFTFVASLNTGDRPVADEDIIKLKKIGAQTWCRQFDDTIGLSPVEKDRLSESSITQTLLKDLPEHKIPRFHPPCYDYGIKMQAPEYLSDHGEIYNLSIQRGTLTKEDRYRINEHMVSGIKMLESLPFPDDLKQVPRLATTHHETLAGKGYPRQIDGSELSVKERILAIADIFEALTAADRPYKKAFTLSKAIAIMEEMVTNKHIDGDLFTLFIEQNLHISYAERFLDRSQIDVENRT